MGSFDPKDSNHVKEYHTDIDMFEKYDVNIEILILNYSIGECRVKAIFAFYFRNKKHSSEIKVSYNLCNLNLFKEMKA